MRNVQRQTVWIAVDEHGVFQFVAAEPAHTVEVRVGNPERVLTSHDVFERCEVRPSVWASVGLRH